MLSFALVLRNPIINIKPLFVIQFSDDDVGNFDSKFTREKPVDTPEDHFITENGDNLFQVELCRR